MADKGHYFNCGNCGYTGEESELKQTKEHSCGEDFCPECKTKGFITCCYTSKDNAEKNHWDNDDCECSECEQKEKRQND